MKFLLKTMIFCSFLLFNQFVLANEVNVPCQHAVCQEGLIQVNMEDLMLTDHGLFLLVGSQTMPISSLFIQDGNYFIYYFGEWRCRFCNTINGDCVVTCWQCGKHRYQ